MSFRFVIPAVALGLAAPLAAADGEPKPAPLTEPAHSTVESKNEATAPMLAVKAGQRAGETAKAMLADTEPTLKLSDVIATAREAIALAQNENGHEGEAGKAES